MDCTAFSHTYTPETPHKRKRAFHHLGRYFFDGFVFINKRYLASKCRHVGLLLASQQAFRVDSIAADKKQRNQRENIAVCL